MVQRLLDTLAYHGGRMHLSPVSTAASVALIRNAKAQGLNVTAGTAPQYLLFTDVHLSDFDSRFRFQPPLRPQADVDALRAAVADGTIDTVDSHHNPVGLEEKVLEFEYAEAGTPSLPWTFAAAYTALVHTGLMPLAALLDRLIQTPRRILNLPTSSDLHVSQLVLVRADQAQVLTGRIAQRQAQVSPFADAGLLGQVQSLAEVLTPSAFAA